MTRSIERSNLPSRELELAGMLARAFELDPLARFVFPDDAVRRRHLVLLYRLYENDAQRSFVRARIRPSPAHAASFSILMNGLIGRTSCSETHELAAKSSSADEPTISAEMPDETLFVATNLAQPGKVKVSVCMRRVEFYASLIGCRRSVIAFQLFENDRAVEVQ